MTKGKQEHVFNESLLSHDVVDELVIDEDVSVETLNFEIPDEFQSEDIESNRIELLKEYSSAV